MKKKLSGLLCACLLLSLSACGSAETADTETSWTVWQMAEAIRTSQEPQMEMTAIQPGDELYETYLTDSYGLDISGVEDGAIFVAGGASAQEIAVLHITGDAGNAAEALRRYLEGRIGAFIGYLPEEAALLEGAEVVVRGNYAALLACADVPTAQEIFARCFTGDPPTEIPVQRQSQPPERESNALVIESTLPAKSSPDEVEAQPQPTDPLEEMSALPLSMPPAPSPTPSAMPEQPTGISSDTPELPPEPPEASAPAVALWSYDKARLLAAWASGDWNGLPAEDKAILDICSQAISSAVPEGASDYEKELAVHDWMIAWGSYDSNNASQIPGFQENPNNDNPYGFLVGKKGICLGYATTFQLFMDLLNIECITVSGTAYDNASAHAWNQVCLDGEWYCIDVTWDDPTTSGTVSAQTAHRYFNVTSEYMRSTRHYWDEGSIPDASGTTYSWG